MGMANTLGQSQTSLTTNQSSVFVVNIPQDTNPYIYQENAPSDPPPSYEEVTKGHWTSDC